MLEVYEDSQVQWILLQSNIGLADDDIAEYWLHNPGVMRPHAPAVLVIHQVHQTYPFCLDVSCA